MGQRRAGGPPLSHLFFSKGGAFGHRPPCLRSPPTLNSTFGGVYHGVYHPCISSFNDQTPLAAGGKVKNAIAHRADRYFGEPTISSMPKNYIEAAIEIAQEAGKILIEELSRPLDIAYKGDEVDLVTQADKRSERLIVERLTKYFPDHAIAAEEGTGHESASASGIRRPVDPLDATTNFAHGYSC